VKGKVLVSGLLCAAISGCGSSSSSSPSSSSSTSGSVSSSQPATALTRTQVCDRFAKYVSNYDYIQQGTSVRAYDILFHTLQRSCPAEAHAAGMDGDAGTPSCVNLYDNRFNCQAFNDPNFPALPST